LPARDRFSADRSASRNAFQVIDRRAQRAAIRLTVYSIYITNSAAVLGSFGVSSDIDAEEDSGEELRTGQPAEEQDLGVAEVERRLAELADDIGELIQRAPVADREALHDYAVSLVREKLPAAVSQPAVRIGGESSAPAAKSAAAGVHLIGYGLLLLPVGFLMMLVFAPLGTILLFAGVAMSIVGLVGGLVGRLRAT
jgi:hypothetical protein